MQTKNLKRAGAVILLGILFLWGMVGCTRATQSSSVTATPGTSAPAITSAGPAVIALNYCTNVSALCIVSMGLDQGNNLLIVLRSSNSSVSNINARIRQGDNWRTYECNPVQLSPNTFYCIGGQLTDGEIVLMEVYSKEDNHLVASGKVLVAMNATPTAGVKSTVATTITPTVVTTVTPSYPNSSYPNTYP